MAGSSQQILGHLVGGAALAGHGFYFRSGAGAALSPRSRHYPHPARGSMPADFITVTSVEVAETICWLRAATCSMGEG